LIYFWNKDPIVASNNLTFLSLSLLTVTVIILLLSKNYFLRAIDKMAIGKFIAAPHDTTPKKTRPFPYLLKGKIGALTEKDWLVVFRSPGQFFQLAFIIFLEIAYFLIITRVPFQRVKSLFPFWYEKRLSALNFLFLNYLTSVLAMRFLFPMISLEGHSSWVIWSSPISRMKIFWQKYISSFLVLLAWLTVSAFLSLKLLPVSQINNWSLFSINLPISLTITAITLGIGAIKPNFWEKNPEKLSTSPGGIMATVLCLGYIGIVSLFLFTQKRGGISSPLIYLAVWLISLFIAFPIFLQVSRKIKRYEV